MNVYEFLGDFLGPVQNSQNIIQLPHDEFAENINLLLNPKDFLNFQKKLLTNLKIVLPNNKKIIKDKFSFFACNENDIFHLGSLPFHKCFKVFLQKHKIGCNPLTYKPWTEEERKELDLHEPSLITKINLLDLLQNELSERFQHLLQLCKLETIVLLETSIVKLQETWEEFVYFIGALYFQDFLKCTTKIEGFKRTSFSLYLSAKEETEFFEYEEKLLEIIYKKFLITENILGLGILEDVNPETCMYIIQKKI